MCFAVYSLKWVIDIEMTDLSFEWLWVYEKIAYTLAPSLWEMFEK